MRAYEERWLPDGPNRLWAEGVHVARFTLGLGDDVTRERLRLAAAAPKLCRALADLVQATRAGTANADHLIEAIAALELAGYRVDMG